MTDIVDRLNDSLSAGYSELRKEAAAEITRLRARIEAMEKQEPAGYVESLFDEYVILVNNFDRAAPVYFAPGAKGETK